MEYRVNKKTLAVVPNGNKRCKVLAANISELVMSLGLRVVKNLLKADINLR